MPRIRSIFASAPAALFAVLVGVSVTSCRPAADPAPLGPEIRIELQTQPGNARVGVPLGTPPVLRLIDRDDELISASGMTVRASLVSGLGQIAAGGEVNVVGGVATFSNLVLVGTTDANIKLGFQLFQDGVANAEVGVIANTFVLQTGPATSIAPQGPPTITGIPGQVVTPAPSVVLKDASGNLVSGATVTFAITAGEGRITGATESITNAQGVATVSGWALGLPGANQLKASMVSPSNPAATQDVLFNASVTTTAGMLRIRVTNAGGGTARVRVLKTSAAGAIHDVVYNIVDSLTVTGLPFGTYQVSGDTLNVGTRIWAADAGVGGLNVSATSGPSIVINYRELGRFEITARGLPTPTQTGGVDFLPTAGDIAVAFAVNVLNDAVTRSSGPLGTYDVVPRVVSVGGQLYTGTPARQSVVLTGGSALAQMTINYAVTTGTLTVVLAGTIPANAAPQIDVTGPGGFHETVFTAGRSWTGLVPGSYTVTASQITVTGVLYKPAPITSVVAVTAGNVTTVTITYNP